MKITNFPLHGRSQRPSHLLHRILLHFILIQSIKHKRDKEEDRTGTLTLYMRKSKREVCTFQYFSTQHSCIYLYLFLNLPSENKLKSHTLIKVSFGINCQAVFLHLVKTMSCNKLCFQAEIKARRDLKRTPGSMFHGKKNIEEIFLVPSPIQS